MSKTTTGGDGRKGWSNLSKTTKVAIIGVPLLIILLLIGATFWLSSYTAAVGDSTVEFTSAIDGEDVSDKIKIEIRNFKDSADYDELKDAYKDSNYEKLVDADYADEISFDITEYKWYMIRVQSYGVFMETDHVIAGAAENYVIELIAYHLSSDVNFNILNRDTLAVITAATTKNATQNLVLMADFPRASINELHKGSGWDISNSEYDDLDTDEKNFMKDQRNYRSQAITYNMSADTNHEYDEDLLRLTETCGFRFTMNDTIGTGVTLATLTVSDQYSDDWDVQYQNSNKYIYLVSLRNLSAPFDVVFALVCGANMTYTTIQSGRVAIPAKVVTAFTVYYNAIGA